MKMLITIIIPVYNEEHNIEAIYHSIVSTMTSLGNQYEYEIVFVDDGSVDGTCAEIKKIAAQNQRVKYLEFSRNFGKEMATSAGLDIASGDAAIMIDADLQHPVEAIPQFLDKWRQGAEVVVGMRNGTRNTGWFKKCGSYFFYKVINAIGETKIAAGATDYRLLDKKVILEFRRFSEHGRITRGLIDWMGFKKDYVYFDAGERINGKAAYSNMKLFKLALSSIVAHSLFPLKLAGYLGMFIMLLSGLLGLALIIGKYIVKNTFVMSISGSAQLAILIIFLVGIILACLGLVALYIANIQTEVTNRPRYIIRNKNV